jgi:hypothetical protein
MVASRTLTVAPRFWLRDITGHTHPSANRDRVKRFQAFDPPEYIEWQPEPEVMLEYEHTAAADPDRAAVIARLSRQELLDLYAGLVRTRLHDVMLKRWVRHAARWE